MVPCDGCVAARADLLRAAAAESRVVQHRAQRERDALLRAPLDLAATNAALREWVEQIVVDYRAGELALHWRHGPVTSLTYDWATEE